MGRHRHAYQPVPDGWRKGRLAEASSAAKPLGDEQVVGECRAHRQLTFALSLPDPLCAG